MSSIVGVAIAVIVVIKKKGFYKSKDKEIKLIEKIIQGEEIKARGIKKQPESESE